MRTNSMGRAVLVAALVAASGAVLLPQDAHAQPKPSKSDVDEAKDRFNRGYELFNEGNFEAALIEFRRAYELAPNYNVLYNIGQVELQLRLYKEALSSLESYLEEGASKISAKRRKDVETDIEKLKARVAKVTITTNVDGATITVDDEDVGVSPLDGPVVVNEGKRRIRATKADFNPAQKTVDVAGRDEMSVELELSEAKPGDPQVVFVPDGGDTPPPTQPKPPPEREIPWLAWGITGGFAITAGVFGAIALASNGELASGRDDAPATADDLDSQATNTRIFAVVTDIAIVGTAVAGGIALYLTLKSPDEPEETSVTLGVKPGGLELMGTF